MNEPLHTPVLMDEVLAELALKPGATVIDATFGLGGYTKAILDEIAPHGKVYGLEQDPYTLEYLEEHEDLDERVVLSRARFSDIEKLVTDQKIKEVDAVVFDLGISSWQLAGNQHGISFVTWSLMPISLAIWVSLYRSSTLFYKNERILDLEGVYIQSRHECCNYPCNDNHSERGRN